MTSETVSPCSHLHMYVFHAYIFVSRILILCNNCLFLSQHAVVYCRLVFILYACLTSSFSY